MTRITSYNVCYTKLLRGGGAGLNTTDGAAYDARANAYGQVDTLQLGSDFRGRLITEDFDVFRQGLATVTVVSIETVTETLPQTETETFTDTETITNTETVTETTTFTATDTVTATDTSYNFV